MAVTWLYSGVSLLGIDAAVICNTPLSVWMLRPSVEKPASVELMRWC